MVAGSTSLPQRLMLWVWRSSLRSSRGGEFARFAGFAVPLSGSGTKTQGVALVNMVHTLDLEGLGARKIERAPVDVVEDALARLQTIVE